jgi:hypothetical protein
LPTITYAGAAAPSGAPPAPDYESVIDGTETADSAGSIAPFRAHSPAPASPMPPVEYLSEDDDDLSEDDDAEMYVVEDWQQDFRL